MSEPPASPRRAVWSSSDFAKLDREDKQGRALLQKITDLKGLVDASPEEVAKLRKTFFNAGGGWNLERLEAEVALLEAAAKDTPSALQEPPNETWVLPPGEADEWDSSDDEEASAPPQPTLAHVDGFVPSATFDGARPGLVFKRGAAGVGYYPDLEVSAGVADLTAKVAELMPAASQPGAT